MPLEKQGVRQNWMPTIDLNNRFNGCNIMKRTITSDYCVVQSETILSGACFYCFKYCGLE